jgi:predicted Na+-dependent transporter
LIGVISSQAIQSLNMTLEVFFSAIAAISGLTFVVASMLGAGLSLTMAQIIQPLKNIRLVILALLANFVLVPLLAYGITLLLPLDQSLQIGLIVLATTAGAPFLVKEVAAAKGNPSLGVGLMFLLMIVTIVYVPIVLPLLLPGVEVNPWDIAKSLIVTMLVPIVLGLMYRSQSSEGAGQWAPVMNKASRVALLIMLVTGLGLNISNIIDLIGSFGFLALILFVIGSLLIGMLLGGARSGCSQCAGVRHSAAQRGGGHPGHQLEFSGHHDSPLCSGGLYYFAAYLDPGSALVG